MQVLIPVAEGFEEIEFAVTVGVLRRAGINVVTAGLPGTQIRGSRGVTMSMDKRTDDVISNYHDYDAIVLLGGNPGYLNLGKSQKILEAIVQMHNSGKLVAAICAAPSILAKAGILNDKKATIYPGMEKDIPRPRGTRLVVDGNVVTAAGPGVAFDFALKIVELLAGSEAARKTREGLVC